MGRWSWCSDAWDFDHDGFPDLYITDGMVTGASRDDLNSFFWRQVIANSPADVKLAPDYEQGWSAINELIRSDGTWSGFERNVFYANNRDGTFSDVSGAVGLDFPEDGRAFALGDFDHAGAGERAKGFEVITAGRRVAAGVTAAQTAAIGEGMLNAVNAPAFLVEH